MPLEQFLCLDPETTPGRSHSLVQQDLIENEDAVAIPIFSL